MYYEKRKIMILHSTSDESVSYYFFMINFNLMGFGPRPYFFFMEIKRLIK